ncbi:MAG: heavy-metal-associated domain-containing protein [Prosthecobacter sp.]|jgi:copper chaperone CopZ|uniref:heavy-metal-associated domain-containing protein n=1 Tax=Prosthecobacter sp. TaxID=1965333 RepID=UPI001A106A29|nr:heavy-metal-associated domain-containing protein [Prosthecobacter sp.]MBE2286465.1 heavy-metal-associated domain-containing protein [Prosthecobacter sp.]
MRLLAVWAILLPFSLHAADKPAPAKTVFVVSGLECGSCVYMVQHQLSQTPGIAEVEVLQGLEGYASVSYDPKLVSEHQIAQAVREAPGLHGMPYIASMKLRVPGFSQHSTQVKALFEKWKPTVELVVWNEHEGELIVNFAELERDAKLVLPRGWSLSQLAEGLKGLGLKYEILSPDTL